LAVIYENLILETEVGAKKICNFLNIDYDENMINPENYLDGNGMGNEWYSNSTLKKVNFVNKKAIDSWKQNLDYELIGVLEYLCQKELESLGYQRITKFSKEDFLNFEENSSEIIEWLQIEEFQLNPKNKLKLIKEIDQDVSTIDKR
jgi:hypothetical protein